jgi:hypothetical protein
MPRTRSRSGSRSTKMASRGLLTELLGRPSRESMWLRALGWAVRARAELAVFTALVTGYILLRMPVGLTAQWALITETTGVMGLVALPATRARMWAVTARHRIYKCFVQTRTMTPSGTMPYLVWSSPSPVGERVRVWLPAGLSVNDIAQTTEALAAACYAAEARVEVNRKFTHLATILIVRRDPFTGKRLEPAYARNVPATGSDGAFAPLPDRTTLPVPTPPADHPTVAGFKNQGRATARRTPTGRDTTTETTDNKPNTPPPVVGIGGMDVSDYV